MLHLFYKNGYYKLQLYEKTDLLKLDFGLTLESRFTFLAFSTDFIF